MKSRNGRGLVLACACLSSLAAFGCGSTADGVDTQGDTSGLQGGGQVQGARGDRDKDVDETADEAAKGSAGSAAPGAPGDAAEPSHGGKGHGRFDDADGGVDEGDCQGRGFIGWHEHEMHDRGRGPGHGGPGAAAGAGGAPSAPGGGGPGRPHAGGSGGSGGSGNGRGFGGRP